MKEEEKQRERKYQNTILEPTISSIPSMWASYLACNKEMAMALLSGSRQS